jgi:hypothetical protein
MVVSRHPCIPAYLAIPVGNRPTRFRKVHSVRNRRLNDVRCTSESTVGLQRKECRSFSNAAPEAWTKRAAIDKARAQRIDGYTCYFVTPQMWVVLDIAAFYRETNQCVIAGKIEFCHFWIPWYFAINRFLGWEHRERSSWERSRFKTLSAWAGPFIRPTQKTGAALAASPLLNAHQNHKTSQQNRKSKNKTKKSFVNKNHPPLSGFQTVEFIRFSDRRWQLHQVFAARN